MSNIIRWKLLFGDSVKPVKAHSKDSGYDCFAHGVKLPNSTFDWNFGETACVENDCYLFDEFILPPGERCLVKTGIAVGLPEDHELQVRPRSGLAFKNGITVLNTPGTVDESYRGEIGVILINHGQHALVIKKDMKIAQLVPAKVAHLDDEVVDELDETDRGSGGFGHTGV